MIDGWHGYLSCEDCGAEPNTPCVSKFDLPANGLVKGQTMLSTPHGGRPHTGDARAKLLAQIDRFTEWCDNAGIAPAPAAPAPTVMIPEQPPAPGPIWTNGLAEVGITPHYSPADLEAARRTLARLQATISQYWPSAALAYCTRGAATGDLAPFQLAMLAAIDQEWTSK